MKTSRDEDYMKLSSTWSVLLHEVYFYSWLQLRKSLSPPCCDWLAFVNIQAIACNIWPRRVLWPNFPLSWRHKDRTVWVGWFLMLLPDSRYLFFVLFFFLSTELLIRQNTKWSVLEICKSSRQGRFIERWCFTHSLIPWRKTLLLLKSDTHESNF